MYLKVDTYKPAEFITDVDQSVVQICKLSHSYAASIFSIVVHNFPHAIVSEV